MSRKTTDKPTSEPDKMFVIGLGDDGKPRGARFRQVDDLIVIRAGDIKLKVVFPASTVVAQVGMKLPEGRLYASGKMFVPNIKRDLYDEMEAALASPEDTSSTLERQEPRNVKCDDEAASPQTTVPTAAAVPPVACVSPMTSGLPKNWETVGVGHMVLVHESPEDGWWEAVVEIREHDVLTLRFRDYPKLPQMVRHISTVALINPGPI